ncbi:MAG: universal stress protein [Deltaproteobacteria bacterium]|nr:universal stress protein [Deltaproteobacteria bacterium]
MKVMICYDGSDVAHEGLEKAIEYFKPQKPEIILLTVTGEALDASMENEEVFEKLEEEQHSVLKEAAEWVASHGLDVDAVLAEGKPQQMIMDAIDKKSPDIVVIARQRKSRFMQHFLGSISAYLVRHAPCHLMIMGPDWKK